MVIIGIKDQLLWNGSGKNREVFAIVNYKS